jgi:predicted MFS family arabinose efflux permease
MNVSGDVAKLALAKGTSAFGGNAAHVAILLVLTRAGDARLLGAYFAAVSLTVTLLAPVFGLVADRFESRKILVLADLLCALSFGVLAVWHELALLFALGVFSAALESMFSAASFVWIGREVEPASRSQALSRMELARNIGNVAGPGAAGILIAATVPPTALALNAITFAASGWLVWQLRSAPRHLSGARRRGLAGEMLAGAPVVLHSRRLLMLIGGWAILAAAASAITVLDPSLAKGTQSGILKFDQATTLGLILTFRAAGAIVTSLWIVFMPNVRPERLVVIGVTGLLLSVLPLSVLPRLEITLALAMAYGAFDSVALVGRLSLVQKWAQGPTLGRVQALLDGVLSIMLTIGSAAAGWLLYANGLQGSYLVLGTAMALTALLVTAAATSHQRSRPWQLTRPS